MDRWSVRGEFSSLLHRCCQVLRGQQVGPDLAEGPLKSELASQAVWSWAAMGSFGPMGLFEFASIPHLACKAVLTRLSPPILHPMSSFGQVKMGLVQEGGEEFVLWAVF